MKIKLKFNIINIKFQFYNGEIFLNPTKKMSVIFFDKIKKKKVTKQARSS